MLTQRALLLGAVALCFYLVAVVNSLQSYYYVLVWLAVGLLAASLGITLLSLTGTSCELRERRPQGFARGESQVNELPPLWEVELHNLGSLNKTGMVLEFHLSSSEKKPERKKGKKTPSARFLIEALPAGETLTAPLVLDFLPRGIYSLESARIIGSDVLGLFRASKRLVIPGSQLKIVVAPAVVPFSMRQEMARGASDMNGARAASRLGVGDDLRGVRTYVQGDDWRHVHWATSARTGELVVREFERTGRDSVLVVWDGALGNFSGRDAKASVERELSFVASLLAAVVTTRTPVDLIVLGRECVAVKANGQNGSLSNETLEVLAGAQAERTRALSECLNKERGGNQKFGQVYFVSSSLGGDLIDCASACVARGERTLVVFFDHSPSPTQSRLPRTSKNSASVASASQKQQKALEAVGARVVRVPMSQEETSPRSLEKALLELAEVI